MVDQNTKYAKIKATNHSLADPSGHAAQGIGLRPLEFWDCGFESR